jgi:hypothetical protein
MIKNIARRILLITFLLCCSVNAFALQAKVIELAPNRSGEKVYTTYVNDQNLLFEINSSSISLLFTPEAIYTILNKSKTCEMESYDGFLEKWIQMMGGDFSASPKKASVSDIEIKISKDSDTIFGIKARKVVIMKQGEPYIETWVSDDLTPEKLKTLGERLRAITPGLFWSRVDVYTFPMYVLMEYGVPLKIIYHIGDKQRVLQGKVLDNEETDSLFTVPAGYRMKNN